MRGLGPSSATLRPPRNGPNVTRDGADPAPTIR